MDIQPPQLSQTFPKYECHKEVRALQIKNVQYLNDPAPAYRITFEPHKGTQFDPVDVSKEWVDRFGPRPRMWFCVYNDGYCSVSPDQAFREGYTLKE